jgi:hypothetical protein
MLHTKLAEKTEDVIFDPTKLGLKIRPDQVDVCYIAMIQSGESSLPVC